MSHPAIPAFKLIVGKQQVLTEEQQTAPYRKGFREGEGPALAVVKPASLVAIWKILQICVEHDLIVIMQAANTGLTGGSTPTEGCDRQTVIINTTLIDTIHLLPEKQILAYAGSTLYQLEALLQPHQRSPHSVIGSSCIGASIVGGVCNNSGGALVERGPAYTELALYAQLDQDGKLRLVNNLDIDLGDSPEEILGRLDKGQFSAKDVHSTERKASDHDYAHWVRDTHSDTPARYNADPRRLHEASGCAGKLAVFAVRLDSFSKPDKQMTLYMGTNSAVTLQRVRRALLEQATFLPISAEYLHRDIFELADQYGRETVLMIKYLGTKYLPLFFRLKRRLAAAVSKVPWVKDNTIDKLIRSISLLFPSQVPEQLKRCNQQFEHQLLLTVSADNYLETGKILDRIQHDTDLDVIHCDENEANMAYLQRFAAAGAAIQYASIHSDVVEDIVALDIALPRNTQQWFEKLPPDLASKISHRLYYGHFLCHVFHQDYLVKKGEDPRLVKEGLLALIAKRGGEYPAEHNVGHLYQAKPALAENYQTLDPTNSFNAGIGGMSKAKHYGLKP